MWLLDTVTLQLEEFYRDCPKYAILSHRWIKGEEASFGDIVGTSEQLEGYRKIRRFCQKAHDDDYKYVWVDTCCIDKRSSAELSEAINSMYGWYKNADVCYVYLADVDDAEALATSSWFSRGWTLQELLAPSTLYFFDCKWRCIGSRQQLVRRLEEITTIPQKALQRFEATDYCIAVKMSWAANRKTSREEDRAYCLLGIFDVNMPLLYGEGWKAFQRLQEEIMKSSTDSSLFIWQGSCCKSFGMLAADPSCFSKIPDFLKREPLQTICKMPEGWTCNNAGMTITGMICPYLFGSGGEAVFILFLNRPFATGPARVGIFIQREDEYRRNQSYRRVAVDDHTWIESEIGNAMNMAKYMSFECRLQHLVITRDPFIRHDGTGICTFVVDVKSSRDFKSVAKQRPRSQPGNILQDWPSITTGAQRSLKCVLEVEGKSAMGLLGHIVVQIADEVDLLVCLGLDDLFRPICVIIPFTAHVHGGKLSAHNILRLCYELLPGDGDTTYAFDTEQHVVALRGTAGSLEFSTQLGADVSIDRGLDSSTFEVSISFDADVFLQYYLRANLTSYLDEQRCIGRQETQGLLEIAAEVFQSRRRSPWL